MDNIYTIGSFLIANKDQTNQRTDRKGEGGKWCKFCSQFEHTHTILSYVITQRYAMALTTLKITHMSHLIRTTDKRTEERMKAWSLQRLRCVNVCFFFYVYYKCEKEAAV